MPGLISPSSAVSPGAIAGMKRAHAAEAAPSYGEPHHKKRKVHHRLQHTQPIEHVVEYTSGEFDATGDSKDFFDMQLRRAIAVQCKSMGFDGTRPEVLESFRGLVDSYMRNFLSQVHKSMSSARRTESVSSDWVYALNSSGITGSSSLEKHFDTGEIPPSLLQPSYAPPEPAEPPPPDLEYLLGDELSGVKDKEARKYIPEHFPPFPSKHTYNATPVYTERQNDPRKIREKATEEGIQAEQSLRRLMVAKKHGQQKTKVGKRKKSKRMLASIQLWEEAMKDLHGDEVAREKEEEENEKATQTDEDSEHDEAQAQARPKKSKVGKLNLEGVAVNYDKKYWRQSARGS